MLPHYLSRNVGVNNLLSSSLIATLREIISSYIKEKLRQRKLVTACWTKIQNCDHNSYGKHYFREKQFDPLASISNQFITLSLSLSLGAWRLPRRLGIGCALQCHPFSRLVDSIDLIFYSWQYRNPLLLMRSKKIYLYFANGRFHPVYCGQIINFNI